MGVRLTSSSNGASHISAVCLVWSAAAAVAAPVSVCASLAQVTTSGEMNFFPEGDSASVLMTYSAHLGYAVLRELRQLHTQLHVQRGETRAVGLAKHAAAQLTPHMHMLESQPRGQAASSTPRTKQLSSQNAAQALPGRAKPFNLTNTTSAMCYAIAMQQALASSGVLRAALRLHSAAFLLQPSEGSPRICFAAAAAEFEGLEPRCTLCDLSAALDAIMEHREPAANEAAGHLVEAFTQYRTRSDAGEGRRAQGQQDAHEFLMFLTHSIDKALHWAQEAGVDDSSKHALSTIRAVLRSTVQVRNTCTKCHTESSSPDVTETCWTGHLKKRDDLPRGTQQTTQQLVDQLAEPTERRCKVCAQSQSKGAAVTSSTGAAAAAGLQQPRGLAPNQKHDTQKECVAAPDVLVIMPTRDEWNSKRKLRSISTVALDIQETLQLQVHQPQQHMQDDDDFVSDATSPRVVWYRCTGMVFMPPVERNAQKSNVLWEPPRHDRSQAGHYAALRLHEARWVLLDDQDNTVRELANFQAAARECRHSSRIIVYERVDPQHVDPQHVRAAAGPAAESEGPGHSKEQKLAQPTAAASEFWQFDDVDMSSQPPLQTSEVEQGAEQQADLVQQCLISSAPPGSDPGGAAGVVAASTPSRLDPANHPVAVTMPLASARAGARAAPAASTAAQPQQGQGGSSMELSAAAAAPAERPPRVAVIGAGAAGLTCAEMLVRAKFEVHLFEARSRVCGRVYTRSWNGQAVSMGATFAYAEDAEVQGQHGKLCNLCEHRAVRQVGAPGEAGADRFVEVGDLDRVSAESGDTESPCYALWISCSSGPTGKPEALKKEKVLKAQKLWCQVRK